MLKRGGFVIGLGLFLVCLPPVLGALRGTARPPVVVTEIPVTLAQPIPPAAQACEAARMWVEADRVVSWRRMCFAGEWVATEMSYRTIADALRAGPMEDCRSGLEVDGLPAWMCDWIRETL